MKAENGDVSEVDFEMSMEYYACQILIYKFKQYPGKEEQRIYQRAYDLYEKLRSKLTKIESVQCIAVREIEKLNGNKTLQIGTYVVQEIIVQSERGALIPNSLQLTKAERLLIEKLS
ncbi:hypothetical protein [Vibrio coralliilyticus]|uniref:hypothetical protein n=1 Tax=Vibrio coralliilyticus TaxID=190893 RepID=UPI00148B80FE|nr:hypothetical protein [Vibrio coralliilyticus]NOI30550.1 hypothetical protein [Vibrio coralliilyticus]NOI49902.1 hypothetical protein [Vibrio coralliilyticus]